MSQLWLPYHKYRQAKAERPNDFVVVDHGEDAYLLFNEEAKRFSCRFDYPLGSCDIDDVTAIPYLIVDFLDLFNFLWDTPNAGELQGARHLVLVSD